MEENKDKKGRKKTGLGFAIWIVAALFLLIIFLLNQNKILSNLKSTNFFENMGLKTPAIVENAEVKETQEKNEVEPFSVNISVLDDSETEENINNDEQESGIINLNQLAKDQEEQKQKEKEKEKPISNPPKEEIKVEEKPITTPVVSTMKLKLYFMVISSNGSVKRQEVVREMKKSNSPLMDSINALINGPTVEEEKLGCRSWISNGTKLIGASVKNGVATLNFSEEFEFNQYGVDGTRGQLQQIVFTATAFPTVDSVRFLIEGEAKDYLGLEGVWIGTPLSRNSF